MNTPPAPDVVTHSPDYSEFGPVWRVVPLEDLPDMATKTVTVWLVVDLDYNEKHHCGYEMARCSKQQDAEAIALSVNQSASLKARVQTLEKALGDLVACHDEDVGMDDFGDDDSVGSEYAPDGKTVIDMKMTFGVLRRARQALSS